MAASADPVLILTGPPGSGKTTVAGLLTAEAERGVHVESDCFFHFITSGYVEPWQPASHEQNKTVMRLVGETAAGYAAAGSTRLRRRCAPPGSGSPTRSSGRPCRLRSSAPQAARRAGSATRQ